MKKMVLLCALAAMFLPTLARAQTAQLINSFTATASGNFADSAIPPQVDSLNVRINGIATAASWTAQIQTSPDNATWTNCGSAVTATSAASASGGACSPTGAAYARVVVTAGSGGGTLFGVLVGNSSLITFNGGGGATFPGTAGVVCNTSTTASVNCSSAAIQSALGSVYLPIGGGTLSGNLSISNPAAAPQNLLYVAGTAGNWASFTVQETNNELVFYSQNQYSYDSPFLQVSASIYGAGNYGTFPNVWGLYVSCAAGIPNTACGGMIQSTANGTMLMSGNYAGTSPVSLTLYGQSSETLGNINPTAAQTVVNCSTSGTATFSEPMQGSSYKKAVVYFAACLGTFSYTFPTAFSFGPQLLSQSITTSVISSITATTASGTGATTTGFADLDGY